MPDSQAARSAQAEDELTRSLARMRARIDALDDEILALIERRLAASKAVAELKSARPDGHLWLRPLREREIIARLCRRAEMAPEALIEAVWRELMAFSLQAQLRTELVLCGAEPDRLARLARNRFGAAAPVRHVADPAQALAAACDSEAVAVIAVEGEPAWTWDFPDRLVIFDWILDDETGEAVAAAIGRIAPSEVPDVPALPATEAER